MQAPPNNIENGQDAKTTVRPRTLAGIFALFFFVYVAISPANLGLDSAIRLEVAKSMINGKGFTAGTRGRIEWMMDGKPVTYSVYGIGQSLLFLPFEVCLIKPLRHFAGARLTEGTEGALIAVTFFPFFGALSMIMLCLLVVELGYSQQIAWRYVLCIGFCTPILIYAVAPHEVTQVMVLQIGGLYLMVRATNLARPTLMYAGVVCVWLVTLARPVMAFDASMLSICGCALWWDRFRTQDLRLARDVLGRTVFVAAILAVSTFSWALLYNYIRFGTVFMNPRMLYFHRAGIDPFAASIWPGLIGPLLSLDKSIFLFCPLAALALLGTRSRLPRGAQIVHVFAAIVFLGTVVGCARLKAWAGDFAVGTRYEMHLVPLLLLPLLRYLEMPRIPHWFKALVAVSLIVQLAQKAFDPGLEIHQNPNLSPEAAELSPTYGGGRWLMRFKNIGYKLNGSIKQHMPPGNEQELRGYFNYLADWDFWWVRSSGV